MPPFIKIHRTPGGWVVEVWRCYAGTYDVEYSSTPYIHHTTAELVAHAWAAADGLEVQELESYFTPDLAPIGGDPELDWYRCPDAGCNHRFTSEDVPTCCPVCRCEG